MPESALRQQPSLSTKTVALIAVVILPLVGTAQVVLVAVTETRFMKLNRILVFWITGVVFACVGLFAADFQSTQTVVVATNFSMSAPKHTLALPDTIFAWDSVTKRIMAIPSENTAQFTFSFANVSSNPVTILSVRPSCNFLSVQLPPLPWTIAPGGNGQIGVTVNLAGKSGTLFRSVLVITDKGSKLLSVKITIPAATPTTMPDAARAHNFALAQMDRQAVFKGECADCHAKPVVGKYGRKLYDTACGICHEAEKRAALVPDLHKINLPTNGEFWRARIEHGKPGTLMPAFSATEGGPLTDNQIKSLANYLAKAIPSK